MRMISLQRNVRVRSYENVSEPLPKGGRNQQQSSCFTAGSCHSLHFTSTSTHSEKSCRSPAVSNSFCNSSSVEYSLTSNARNLHYTREAHEYAAVCQRIIIHSVAFASAIVLNYTFCVPVVLLFQTVH